MRKLSLVAVLLFVITFSTLPIFANNSPSYIERFRDIAIREMHRSGIPASITLAQAIHESGWGNGTLAVNSNNYFGIKCKDYWTGPTYYIEDDDFENGTLVKSCFRAYERIEESFVDHSDFLRDNPRYKELFQLNITDYSAWAKGLQKCGYATDQAYAKKLIKNIEKYQLYHFDSSPDPKEQVPVFFNDTPEELIAAAPVFDIQDFLTSSNTNSADFSVASNQSNPTEETITYEIPHENYEVPEAYSLPDDYVRRNNNENVPELILGDIDWVASTEIPEKQEGLNFSNEESYEVVGPAVAPVIQQYQEMSPVSSPVIKPDPVYSAVEPAIAPSPVTQNEIMSMTYTEDKKLSQLNRRPRASTERRR